ncbi:hypothetical protein ACFZDJ_40430 [Streptomyces sp. NPDC007896]|uniref:hypothetical protein n=1 Tax=Streptomyces sp. NPDC007896 TaxID=3364784 RepID=UPI0036ED182C
MADVVTVEVWNPSYQHSKIDLSALPEVYRSIPESASIGLTLADTEDDCVIATVEPEFSMGRTVSIAVSVVVRLVAGLIAAVDG